MLSALAEASCSVLSWEMEKLRFSVLTLVRRTLFARRDTARFGRFATSRTSWRAALSR